MGVGINDLAIMIKMYPDVIASLEIIKDNNDESSNL